MSNNREFFSLPVHEAVALIVDHAANVDATNGGADEDNNDDDGLLDHDEDDELAGLDLAVLPRREPWHDIMEADNFYYGIGDTIQDYRSALRLYKQAARMGCQEAYDRIGHMYDMGEGVKEDKEKALEYWKAGVRAGNTICLARTAALFVLEGIVDNAQKCAGLFIDEIMKDAEVNLKCPDMANALFTVLNYWVRTNTDMRPFNHLRPYKGHILEILNERRKRLSEWRGKGHIPVENIEFEQRSLVMVEEYISNTF